MRGLRQGALVMLRSGGPEMVIERIDRFYGSAERYAWCKWFDRSRLKSDRFAVHVLELSRPAPRGIAEPRDVPILSDEDIDRAADAADDEMFEEEDDDTETSDEEDDDDGAARPFGEIAAAILAARQRAIRLSAASP